MIDGIQRLAKRTDSTGFRVHTSSAPLSTCGRAAADEGQTSVYVQSVTEGNILVAAKLRNAFHMREFFYPSNILTLARLLLLPPTLAYLRRPERRQRALICLGAAMLTDAIDGPVARYRDEESELGKILDPIADKLMLDATAVTLSQTRDFPWWITTMLLLRDIIILLAALLVYRRKAKIPSAQATGKATTVALTTAIALYTADGPRSGKPALYVALIPFIFSIWEYGRQFAALMRRDAQDRPT